MGLIPPGPVHVKIKCAISYSVKRSREANLRSFKPTVLYVSLTRRGDKLAEISYFLYEIIIIMYIQYSAFDQCYLGRTKPV